MSIDDGWFRWTPQNARESVFGDLRPLIDEFESVPTDSGKKSAEWLRKSALSDYPSTVTWVLKSESGRQIDGFFALASDSIKLNKEHRKELPHEQPSSIPEPVQGASLIAWIARHRNSETPGRLIMHYAIYIALKVAHLQGTPVAVLDPLNNIPTAEHMEKHYGFRRSFTADHSQIRLWVPLWVPLHAA